MELYYTSLSMINVQSMDNNVGNSVVSSLNTIDSSFIDINNCEFSNNIISTGSGSSSNKLTLGSNDEINITNLKFYGVTSKYLECGV